jgi:phosphoglycolate phosphatase
MTTGRPFDLVIFDLDGTLVDSVPDITWSLNTAFAEIGLPGLAPEIVTRFIGDGAATLIERTLPPGTASHDLALLLARFLSHYADHLSVDSRLYAGIPSLLTNLSRAGITSAVVTNKPGALARELLQAMAVANHFSSIVGDGDGFPRKPDPAAARAIITQVGATPERTVVLGDGLPDIGMSRAIPCPAIAATWGYVPAATLQSQLPAYVANSVDEVARILMG